MVTIGDKTVHVSEVPGLHPARIWPAVAAMMPNPTAERRREFISLMHHIKTNVSSERAEPTPEIEDDFKALAKHLTKAVKVIERLGTKRGAAGASALARFNGRLQSAPGRLPVTLDQWQDVQRRTITIAYGEAKRVDEALHESGRKGKRGPRQKKARDAGLKDLKEWWSQHGSNGFAEFADEVNKSIIDQRAQHHLLGERESRDKALSKFRRRRK